MPCTFTRAELARLTVGEYNSLSPDDRLLYDRALVALWADDYNRQSQTELQRDYDFIASHRRFEIGE